MFTAFFFTGFMVMMWIVAEFRAQRWVRLVFGAAAMSCLIGMAALIAFVNRVDLADHYRTANNNLAYAIEAAIKDGHPDRVVPVLSALRNQGNFDIGTPPDYYHAIQSAADQINSSPKAGR